MSSLRPSPSPAADPAAEMLQVTAIWHKIVNHRWLVLSIVAVVVGLTVLFTRMQTPEYESTATLRIEESSRANPLSELAPPSALGAGKLETEILVLSSRTLAESVVDSLDLVVQVTEPAGVRSEIFSDVSVPRDVVPGEFRLERNDRGEYRLSRVEGDAALSLPQAVVPGSPVEIGGARLTLAPELRRQGPERIEFELLPFKGAVALFQRSLGVSRVDPKAAVVAIRFESTDPEMAAAVPNALTTSFIRYKREEGKTESQSAVDFLREQVAEYENDLRGAEERLRAYRESAQVVSVGDEATVQVERLAKLQAQRDGLTAEREALAPLLARVADTRDDGETAPYRQLASFPVFLANQAVQNLLSSITELENTRSELLVKRTAQNQDVRALDARIQELEMQLYQVGRNYLQSLDNQIASTDATLARFEKELAGIPAREVEFFRLSREQDLLGDIFTMLQTRLKEAELKAALEPGDVHVIDAAPVPSLPFAPRPLRNLVIAVFMGVVLGVGAALTVEALDTKVRSQEDVQQVTGGLPVFGTIPQMQLADTGTNGRKKLPFRVEIPSHERLITRLDPHSPASEAYRMLRTNVSFAGLGNKARVLLVTSAMPGDGKSTSSSNLAVTLAQQGIRTLLVDADLRKGVLHQVFGVSQDPGLAHVLVGTVRLSEAVRQVSASEIGVPLDFLPSGIFPPNPSELVGSDRMREVLAEMRKEYEMVVIDAPPLNLVTDAVLLSALSDATLLVARADVTDKRALSHAAAQLSHAHTPIKGIVLNGLNTSKMSNGTGYYAYGYAPATGNGKKS
jgi:capsular exopolysaccharide synthesis family protein